VVPVALRGVAARLRVQHAHDQGVCKGSCQPCSRSL
jgi:hypothetical protein